MKYRIIFSIVLFPALAFFTPHTAVAGDWGDEFAVTQDPVLQYRSYITVAPDDTVFVLWPDWSDFEDTKVTLTRSENKGNTWSTPSILFDGKAYDNFDLFADGDGLHLLLVEFWEDNNEHKELYYTKSLDKGVTFSKPVRIGIRENIEQVNLFSDSGTLFIFAMNYPFGTPVNYLYVSKDGGMTWQEKPVLPGTPVGNPDFSIENNIIHMVFGGYMVTPDIHHCISTDNGDTWSTPVAVSSGAGNHSQLPTIVLDDQAIHVSWEDDRTNHFNIFYSRSTDGGLTWSNDVRLNDTYYGARPKLHAGEEGLHIVWCQYHGDNGWPSSWSSADYGIIWYKFSDDSGLTWTQEFRVSQNDAIPPIQLPDQGANHVKITGYSKGFCTLWQDKRDGNVDLYMRNHFFRAQLDPDVNTISAGAGGTVNFTLAAGTDNANRFHLLLSGVSGTKPGFALPGGDPLPLNYDLFTGNALSLVNTPVFSNFMGQLDAAGMSMAMLDTLGPLDPQYIGLVLYFAYTVNSTPSYIASIPVEIEIVP